MSRRFMSEEHAHVLHFKLTEDRVRRNKVLGRIKDAVELSQLRTSGKLAEQDASEVYVLVRSDKIREPAIRKLTDFDAERKHIEIERPAYNLFKAGRLAGVKYGESPEVQALLNNTLDLTFSQFLGGTLDEEIEARNKTLNARRTRS